MNNIESVYYYIASVNPENAVSLLTDKYGYSIMGDISEEDIAEKLYEIVQTDGHRALVDVMNLHPDKMMILELYAPEEVKNNEPAPATMTIPPLPMGSHMDGHEKPKNFLDSPTNVMILGVAIIAGIALLKS